MKYTIHVPVEQYGFVGIETDDESGIITTPGKVAELYRDIQNGFKFGDGLPEITFREIFDKVMDKEAINGDPGILDGMNSHQRFCIDQARKWRKRKAGIKDLTK